MFGLSVWVLAPSFTWSKGFSIFHLCQCAGSHSKLITNAVSEECTYGFLKRSPTEYLNTAVPRALLDQSSAGEQTSRRAAPAARLTRQPKPSRPPTTAAASAIFRDPRGRSTSHLQVRLLPLKLHDRPFRRVRNVVERQWIWCVVSESLE